MLWIDWPTCLPLLKGPVIDAAADLVLADGKVQVQEAELLRTIAALLECPLPPCLPTERSAAYGGGHAPIPPQPL